MAKRKLRVITFLAPNMEAVYRDTLAYVGAKLGHEMELVVGTDYEQTFAADLSFICGLPYVLRTSPRRDPSPIEALVAPVLRGARYGGRSVYFSDVVVHRDSPFQSFADLRGCSWAYNEPESQSGYGITRYWLVKLGATDGYFGRVVEAGFHDRALRMVAAGTVDASAIDSQVLAVELRDHPELAEQVRVIEALGPSTIQPIAVRADLPQTLKGALREAFAAMHHDPAARAWLDRGFIERFIPVTDADYDDIRAMLAACEQAGLMTLR